MREITKSKLREINYKLWSLIVRKKWNSVCLKCYADNLKKGMSPEKAREKATKQVDAHHIFEKGMNHSLMFEPDNGITLCFYHHKHWIHSTAIPEKEREDFIIQAIGESKYAELCEKKRQLVKTNMDFYIENLRKLYNICIKEGIDTTKIVPQYIVKQFLSEEFEKEIKEDKE
jgi:hypothetical protein